MHYYIFKKRKKAEINDKTCEGNINFSNKTMAAV